MSRQLFPKNNLLNSSLSLAFVFAFWSGSFACMSCDIPIDKMTGINDLDSLLNQSYSDSTELSTRWERPLFSEKNLNIYKNALTFEQDPLNNQILYTESQSTVADSNGDGDSVSTVSNNSKEESTDEVSNQDSVPIEDSSDESPQVAQTSDEE